MTIFLQFSSLKCASIETVQKFEKKKYRCLKDEAELYDPKKSSTFLEVPGGWTGTVNFVSGSLKGKQVKDWMWIGEVDEQSPEDKTGISVTTGGGAAAASTLQISEQKDMPSSTLQLEKVETAIPAGLNPNQAQDAKIVTNQNQAVAKVGTLNIDSIQSSKNILKF